MSERSTGTIAARTWSGGTSREALLARLESLAPVLMAVIIVAWIAVIFATSVYKYLNYGQGYDQVDFEQAIWNTVHGRIMEDSRFNFTGSVFGMDWMPMLFFFVPFYALAPSALTLFFLQIVGSALGAIPVYWLARDRLGSKLAGVGLGATYLLYPTLLHTALNPFQVRLFALTLLLFAFYYFEKGNWYLFAALSLLAMLARTDVALVVAMFGVYALLTRRKWPYVVAPLAAGLGYFALSTFVIVPSYAYPGALSGGSGGSLGSNYMDCWPCGGNPILAYYGHLGRNGGEIVTYIVTHPIQVAGIMFTPEKIGYILLLLAPLAFLPLLEPRPLVLGLPILVMNLLSLRTAQISYETHYSLMMIPGLIYAAIYGAARLRGWAARWRERRGASAPGALAGGVGALALAVLALVLTVPYRNPVLRTLRYHETPSRVAAANQLESMIPAGAKVAASSKLAPRLLPRQYLYNFPPAPYSPYNFGSHSSPSYVDLDYILVDPQASALDVVGNKIDNKTGLELLQALPGWHKVASKEGILLFARR